MSKKVEGVILDLYEDDVRVCLNNKTNAILPKILFSEWNSIKTGQHKKEIEKLLEGIKINEVMQMD